MSKGGISVKVYIAGEITGDRNYREKFSCAQGDLEGQGFTVLNPAKLPEGLLPEDYMRICMAMMDSADIVAFLPDYEQSRGAQIEWAWCQYVSKQTMYLESMSFYRTYPKEDDHKTAHIDREALKPCSRCRPQENSLDRFSGHEFLIDDAEIYFYDSEDGWEGEEIKFCPWCGRPLTEEAEVHCETLEKMVKEYQETIIPGYRKRAETAEETASDLCDDFTDFVTGGVHNAAPYCSNRRPECVDAHGWCDGDNRVCRGFVPKAAVGRKEE